MTAARRAARSTREAIRKNPRADRVYRTSVGVVGGTTTALVFGSHFESAMDILFATGQDVGLNLTTGLVLSDGDRAERKA